MNRRKFIFLILSLFIGITCNTGRLSATPTQIGDGSIGTISRVVDIVQQNNQQVNTTNLLYRNDNLRLSSGGEGLLDFGSDLRLRIFNDTEVGGVRTDNVPGSPLDVTMVLFAGGFSGQLIRPGAKATFETPNGAQIVVFGTTFLLVYDFQRRETFVGNFEGQVQVGSAGNPPISVSPGMIYLVRVNEAPTPWAEIPWTPAGYDQRAREMQSARAPLDLAVPITTPEVPPLITLTPTPTQYLVTATWTRTPTPRPTYTPTPTQTTVPCPPKLTVIKNAFCREGPSQVYEAERTYLIGQILQVEGRNKDNSWWWVLIPDKPAHCWISNVTVKIEGETGCLPYITPPPTYTPSPAPTDTPTLTMTY